MKIAIDIDEVLFKFVEGYLELAMIKGHKKVSFEEVHSFNLWEVLKMTREESILLAGEFHDLESFNIDRIIPGAKEFLETLSKYELFFITSRPIEWKEKTISFLGDNFNICKSKIFFSGDLHKGQSKKKEEICEELGIKILIDDNKDYALSCAKKGMKVLVPSKPWNKNCEQDNIFRCDEWSEILEYIENEARENSKEVLEENGE